MNFSILDGPGSTQTFSFDTRGVSEFSVTFQMQTLASVSRSSSQLGLPAQFSQMAINPLPPPNQYFPSLPSAVAPSQTTVKDNQRAVSYFLGSDPTNNSVSKGGQTQNIAVPSSATDIKHVPIDFVNSFANVVLEVQSPKDTKLAVSQAFSISQNEKMAPSRAGKNDTTNDSAIEPAPLIDNSSTSLTKNGKQVKTPPRIASLPQSQLDLASVSEKNGAALSSHALSNSVSSRTSATSKSQTPMFNSGLQSSIHARTTAPSHPVMVFSELSPESLQYSKLL